MTGFHPAKSCDTSGHRRDPIGRFPASLRTTRFDNRPWNTHCRAGRRRLNNPPTVNRVTGFSLIELVLALGLSVIVIGSIAYATHLYMVTLTRQQADIERKQVARGVVMMLQNDLRNAIQYKAQDYSGLENLLSSQALAGGSAALEALTGEAGSESGTEDPRETESGGSSTGTGGVSGLGSGTGSVSGSGSGTGSVSASGSGSGVAVEEDTATSRPTLIGDSQSLVIDVSRLPRLDEYNPLVATQGAQVQLPSDVKAVCYFHSTQPPAQHEQLFSDLSQRGGLYRRQIDRAVAAYRNDTGLVASPDDYSQLVAQEVHAVSFRYFDGTDWQSSWDSEEAGGFPTAVEVTLMIDPYRAADPDLAGDVDQMDIYRTVIHLPAAEPQPESE